MKVEQIAENALKIISESEGREPLKEQIDLNYLQEVLSKGGRIILSKKNSEEKVERNVAELISSLKRLGMEILLEDEEKKGEKPPESTASSPDKQILEEILSEVVEKETPCIIEPGKTCVNCNGRCKTLGF